jgi:catechol 2,3-dioxygenase-like lactoylglutathione lyase family enzyme
MDVSAIDTPNLSRVCAPMIYRRAIDLESSRAYAVDVLAWPAVGDPGPLHDGGGAVIGFGFQATKMTNEICSRENLRPVEAVINPASEIEVVPADFDDVARRVVELVGPEDRLVDGGSPGAGWGSRLQFFDATGNLTTLVSPPDGSATDAVGERLGEIVALRGIGPTASGHATHLATVVGMTHVVASLGRSLAFYRDALGLKVLRSSRQEVKFDLGNLILTVRSEPQLGLVAAVRKRMAFRDSLIFLVPDLDLQMQRLRSRGINFPRGVERSSTAGRMAFFFDPDGHRLILWGPPGRQTPDMPVSYYPVLRRILEETGMGDLLRDREEVA